MRLVGIAARGCLPHESGVDAEYEPLRRRDVDPGRDRRARSHEQLRERLELARIRITLLGGDEAAEPAGLARDLALARPAGVRLRRAAHRTGEPARLAPERRRLRAHCEHLRGGVAL